MDPRFRNVSFDELVEPYTETTRSLVDGGVDILLIETVFDTLDCKAAIYALLKIFDEEKMRIPVIVSGTIPGPGDRYKTQPTPQHATKNDQQEIETEIDTLAEPW